MKATKYFVLASFLLTAVDGFGQARKAKPPEGLSIGSLNGASLGSTPLNAASLNGPSLPLPWPFKPRETEAAPMPSFVPATRPAPQFLPPPPAEKTEPGELYYLLKAKSVEVPDGIIGLKSGTKLRKQPDGSFLFSGTKLTFPDSEVTNDLEVARRAGVSDLPPPTPASVPPTATPEPGHVRIGETAESFRRTPNLQWLGGSMFQLDTYSIVAVFWEGKCHEITFADLVQDTVTNRVLRDARRTNGQYDKFFAAVLKANAGESEWLEESTDSHNRKWRRADGAMKAEATNNEIRAGVITLTTTELTKHRLENSPGYQRVLEGL